MEYGWLRTIKGLGPVIEKGYCQHLIARAIYDACEEELKTVYGIGDSISNAILSSRSLEKAYSILNNCEKQNIKIHYNDSLYPNTAKEYTDAQPYCIIKEI